MKHQAITSTIIMKVYNDTGTSAVERGAEVCFKAKE